MRLFLATGFGLGRFPFGGSLASLAACLVAVAFDTGGVADALSPGNGLQVAAGDFPAFATAVTRVLSGASGLSREGCRRHAAGYAWPRFGESVRALAHRTIERHG